MSLVYTSLPDKSTLITGNTFPLKTVFRDLGGRWDARLKGWIMPPECNLSKLGLTPPSAPTEKSVPNPPAETSPGASIPKADVPAPSDPVPKADVVAPSTLTSKAETVVSISSAPAAEKSVSDATAPGVGSGSVPKLAKGVFYEERAQEIHIAGNTFNMRGELRDLGARWSSAWKSWVLPLSFDVSILEGLGISKAGVVPVSQDSEGGARAAETLSMKQVAKPAMRLIVSKNTFMVRDEIKKAGFR
jgi:hypothetical protein